METMVTQLVIFSLILELASAFPPQADRSNTTGPISSNKTIADLVQKQTDTIKQIVSNQQSKLDYAIATKYSPTEVKKQDLETLSLEELKIKCEHLSKLAASRANNTKDSEAHSSNNHYKVIQPVYKPPNGFYITKNEAPPVTTTTPKTTTQQNIKYIKLEPVILQKTILNDGRVVYYWHKSLPSAVEVASPLAPPTTPSTTTTTTSSGYGFRNFFPSFYLLGGSDPPIETTTETTTTTTERSPEEAEFQPQLKFVLPIPYVSPENPIVKKPWDLDPHAYYPKPFQPETMNIQVPYVPTFHVIKAINIPNPQDNSNLDSVNM